MLPTQDDHDSLYDIERLRRERDRTDQWRGYAYLLSVLGGGTGLAYGLRWFADHF